MSTGLGDTRIRWTSFPVLLLAVAALAGWAPFAARAGEAGPTIKIISSLPRTGASKGESDGIVNGINMALSEANNQAGGFTIVYEDLDDATAARGSWDADKEITNATTAIDDPQVMAYIGTVDSGAAALSIPLLCQADVAMVSTSNTYPGLTKPDAFDPGEPGKYYPDGCARNFVRLIPPDDLQGPAGAEWARSLNAQRVYVLNDGGKYGAGISSTFAVAAKQKGLDLVGGPETIDPAASDYRALAEEISLALPDFIYYGGTAQGSVGRLWQDLKAEIPDAKLMAPDALLEQSFIQLAGSAAEGTYITFGGVPPQQLAGSGAAWYTRYRADFHTDPEAYSIYGYEAANVILAAINRVGTADRAAIRDAIVDTSDFDGVLGVWSFDADGDTTLVNFSGRQVRNGQFDDANAVSILGY